MKITVYLINTRVNKSLCYYYQHVVRVNTLYINLYSYISTMVPKETGLTFDIVSQSSPINVEDVISVTPC